MELKHLTRDAVRELLMIINEGQRLREASWDDSREPDWNGGKYSRLEEECFVEAAGGDENLGRLASLFNYWSNDVTSMAAFYGIGFLKDGTFSTDLPPPPTPEHWWSEGEWQPPFDPQGEGVEH